MAATKAELATMWLWKVLVVIVNGLVIGFLLSGNEMVPHTQKAQTLHATSMPLGARGNGIGGVHSAVNLGSILATPTLSLKPAHIFMVPPASTLAPKKISNLIVRPRIFTENMIPASIEMVELGIFAERKAEAPA